MKKIKIFKAFSLAEALVTLLIVCLITVASIPVITKKKRVKKEQSNIHGAFACYWDESQQNLIGKYLINGEVTDADIVTDDKEQETIRYFNKAGRQQTKTQARSGCVFNPPAGARNFVVTIVGGGGGGAGGFVREAYNIWTLDDAGTQVLQGKSNEDYSTSQDASVTAGEGEVSGEEGNDLAESEEETAASVGSFSEFSMTLPVTAKYDFLVVGAGGGGGETFKGTCDDGGALAKEWPCGVTGTPGGVVISRDNYLAKGTTLNVKVGKGGEIAKNLFLWQAIPGQAGGDSSITVSGEVNQNGKSTKYIFAQGGGGGATWDYNGSGVNAFYAYTGNNGYTTNENLATADQGAIVQRLTYKEKTPNGNRSQALQAVTRAGSGFPGGCLVRGFNYSNSTSCQEATYRPKWYEYEKTASYLLDDSWALVTKNKVGAKTFISSTGKKTRDENFSFGRPYRNSLMTEELMSEFYIKSKENQSFPFASGGSAGHSRSDLGGFYAKQGGRGVVVAKWLETYGGLGGRAGKVLQLPYAELPKGTVVFPGKGGFGGGFVPYLKPGFLSHRYEIKPYSATNGLSSYMKNGQEVLGGSGAVAVDITDNSTYYKVDDDNTSIGQNGEMASVSPKVKAAGGAGGQTSKEQNSYINNTTNFNGLTRGVFLNNKAIGSFNEIVGAGAGGGGGAVNINYSGNRTIYLRTDLAEKNIAENYGQGARGSSGLVFIQW